MDIKQESATINYFERYNKRLPKLHKDVLSISLYEYTDIKKAYADVLGLNAIDHLSINIVNPSGEMVFLSSTPYTGINVCSSDLWLYDSSIHPNTYENKEFYWWDDCYEPKMREILKREKEIKNNLCFGFVFSKEIEGFYLLYSFATKEKDPAIKQMIEKYKNTFIGMGDYCYSEIRPLYERYCGTHQPPIINKHNFSKDKVIHKDRDIIYV